VVGEFGMGQPHVRVGAALSLDPEPRGVAVEATAEGVGRLGGKEADLAIVFASIHFAPQAACSPSFSYSPARENDARETCDDSLIRRLVRGARAFCSVLTAICELGNVRSSQLPPRHVGPIVLPSFVPIIVTTTSSARLIVSASKGTRSHSCEARQLRFMHAGYSKAKGARKRGLAWEMIE
jgi:hypothetical protein